MFKAMILLTKKPEMSADEFRHWLLDEDTDASRHVRERVGGDPTADLRRVGVHEGLLGIEPELGDRVGRRVR